MLLIDTVQNILSDIFNEKNCYTTNYDVTYEKSYKDYYKLVITIHNLLYNDANIIHTKFIFKVNKDKTELLDNSFLYLFDINCIYHKIDFENDKDLKDKLLHIIQTSDFGTDIRILSDFIGSPAMFLNYYMRENNITEYSVFDVIYNPKFKHVPCMDITFDFDISINDDYNIEVSIKKIVDKETSYNFTFKMKNIIKTIHVSSLNNIHFTIGSNIAIILQDILK